MPPEPTMKKNKNHDGMGNIMMDLSCYFFIQPVNKVGIKKQRKETGELFAGWASVADEALL